MSKLNGGLTHGILSLLNHNQDGVRATDIVNVFPSLFSGSSLTTLRRKGLIAKAGKLQFDPYVITNEGRTLLAELDNYTPATYWENVWGMNKVSPGTRSSLKGVDITKYPWEQPTYMGTRHYGLGC